MLLRLLLIFALVVLASCDSDGKCSRKNPNTLILIKGSSLTVEVADNQVSRQCGLSNRNTLDPDTGMLFIFEKARLHSFWMKNTSIPLAVAFIDKEMNIINIENMPANDASHRYRPTKPALYAIETHIDWFSEHNIQAGDKVKFYLNY